MAGDDRGDRADGETGDVTGVAGRDLMLGWTGPLFDERYVLGASRTATRSDGDRPVPVPSPTLRRWHRGKSNHIRALVRGETEAR